MNLNNKIYRQLFSKFLIFFILIFSLTCSKTQKKTYVVINFDVEDYTTPKSYGIDKIPKWLAEIMTEEGATGTFFVIGEKARSFEKRGRTDVIAAMAKHDIGSHTNFGSIHPTVTEQLEKATWDEGVQQMIEQESIGMKELERIFGNPVTTLARHGGSYGPQLIHALGKMNAGYIGSPIVLPGKNAVWFCNTLNIYGQYGGFDNDYYRDDLFEPLLDSLKVRFPKLVQQSEIISFFAGHPCKIRTKQFWDFNYYYGANPDSSQWKTPEMRPLESMKTAQKNFRRLVQYLKSLENVELTTFGSLMKRYSSQKEFMTKKELIEIAQRTIEEKAISFGKYFSPAEVFVGLVESILNYQSINSLPTNIKRNSILGPIEMPNSEPEISSLTLDEVYDLAQKAIDYVNNFKHLPSFLKIKNAKIGTGSLYALFSDVYIDVSSSNTKNRYNVPKFDPYPKPNEDEIIGRVTGYKNWPVHRRDLDMSHLVEMTRLQLWTLKPAYKK